MGIGGGSGDEAGDAGVLDARNDDRLSDRVPVLEKGPGQAGSEVDGVRAGQGPAGLPLENLEAEDVEEALVGENGDAPDRPFVPEPLRAGPGDSDGRFQGCSPGPR
jgi:hypothetical protein